MSQVFGSRRIWQVQKKKLQIRLACEYGSACEGFFFSSRRRHTRYIGDWSSDVCSSDLIHDVAHPRRIAAVADSNFSYWHSATFNNDGTKLLFSDEWGGGGQPKCRATDKPEWGADAIFTVANGTMTFQSYYKMPAPQTPFENCVAHNGSLIPIPGRDVMVQGWYQGGISVFDWTDPAHPKEIAFFDRGPVDSTKLASGGSWSAYWYNGYIYHFDITRGLDIFD